MSKYHLVCGMEVHAELKTKSKMFCGCGNDPFGAAAPNIHTCPVCLGMPGGVPVPNKKAIEWIIKLGLFLDCKINLKSKFDRKNYFYPDLAKGYQISQYDLPFCYDGKIETSEGVVRIERIHMEEDTGKLLHSEIDGEKVSLIDFNRSGVALIEVVTKPDIKTPSQAAEYAKKLREAIRYLGIGDGDMEKGGMRLEANISLQTDEQHAKAELPGYKVEVKNINSFNFMKQAVEFEMVRQSEMLDKGETIAQETRGFNSVKQITFPQRSKENAADYRYFPDPDIPTIIFEEAQIEKWRSELPKKAEEVASAWQKKYGLEEKESLFFLENHDLRVWAENLWALALTNKIEVSKLAKMLINKKLNWEVSEPTEVIVGRFLQENKTDDLDETELVNAVKKVLQENDEAVTRYKNGEKKLQGFFMGQIMRELAGKKPEMQMLSKVLMKELQ